MCDSLGAENDLWISAPRMTSKEVDMPLLYSRPKILLMTCSNWEEHLGLNL